ncbi:ParA family protein [Xenorhabdus bovienii]|uniref:ATPase n=2 Tax=Xenorhabdus bovienii TaxID=40576 RepID=A0A077NIS7_XENBV|nr:ParA family protein [Xenorhabdus bovienii]MCG3471387.1 ParA family protein [Xenorhabdus bovienii]CDG97755.1 ATPase [Xenorhabdus bovienii str. puntauvense]CDH00578.1 ATPase [Xenorhabdus bovienii str. feltiae Moldova]
MAKSVKSKKTGSSVSLLHKKIVEAIRAAHPIFGNSNDKGGVGKTTVTAHEAWYLASLGLKVLVIDFDKHITKMFFENAIPDLSEFAYASDLFSDEGITKPIYEMPNHQNIWFLPAEHEMKGIDSRPMSSGIVVYPRFHLQSLRDDFDVIVIDTPPGEGNRQQAGLLACTHAVLVTEMGALSIGGVSDAISITNELIDNINANNPDQDMTKPSYIVIPNKFNSRRSRHKDYLAQLKQLDVNLTPCINDRETFGISTDTAIPVWKFDDGNARLAAKEVKNVLNYIFLEVAK